MSGFKQAVDELATALSELKAKIDLLAESAAQQTASIPSTVDELVTRAEGFTWGEWVAAHGGKVYRAVDAWEGLIDHAQYYLVDDRTAAEQWADCDSLSGIHDYDDYYCIWDGGVGWVHFDGRRRFPAWIGSDGACGGFGQTRLRALTNDSTFKPV